MNVRGAALLLVVCMVAVSCSRKSALSERKETSEAQRELAQQSRLANATEERQPEEDQIADDCAAFVRATKIVPQARASTDCPGCAAGGMEVLSFRQARTETVSCSGDSCNVVATIRAVFNPGSGESIGGGLTGWIPPEERTAYLRGQTPSGEQTFRVQITYKRRGNRWQPVEFDRAARQ